MLSLAGVTAATMTSVAFGPPTFVGQVPRIKIEPPPPSDSPQSESAPSDVTSESSTSPLVGLSGRGLSLDSALDGDHDSGRGGGAAGADSVSHTTIDLRRQPGKFKKCLHHRFLHQAYSEERAGAPRHDTKRSRSFDNATAAGRGGGRGRSGAGSDTDDGKSDHRDRPLDLSVSTRSSLDVHVGPTETRNIFEARARERHMRRRSESDDAPSMDLLRAWLDAPSGGGSAQRLTVASSRFSYSDLQLSAIHRRDHYAGLNPFVDHLNGTSAGGDLEFRAAAAAASSSQHRLVVAAAVAAATAAPVFSPYVRPPPLPLSSPALQHQQRAPHVAVKCGSFPESFDCGDRDFGAVADGGSLAAAAAYARMPKLSPPFGTPGRPDDAVVTDASGTTRTVNPRSHAAGSGATDVALTTATALARDSYPGPGGGSIIRCPRCHQTFHTFDSLTKHMAKHSSIAALGGAVASASVEAPSGDGDASSTADGCCGGSFGTSGEGSDGSGGVGSRLHSCKVCDRSFSRSDMLTRHMRLHTGLKPYECQLCGQLFSRSDHLNTHQRTHTGERPYRCPHCLYSACRRDMITRHMRIHGRDLKAKRRRMLMYLRSDGGAGGGGGGGSAGSLSSGAESSYESSSGGGATSRSANSSADSGSFDSAAVVAAAAAAAAASYCGGETQRRPPRHLLLPPRVGGGDVTHQRDWLGAALWTSLAVAGAADGPAGCGGRGRRLLSPSWSGTSSESAESDYSGRPGSALAAAGATSSLPKSGSASPRDAYSDSFESDVSGVSGDRWFVHRSDDAAASTATAAGRSPRASLPSSAPLSPTTMAAPVATRRGLVRQDASLELEEEDDYAAAAGRTDVDCSGRAATEADATMLCGGRISTAHVPQVKAVSPCAASPYSTHAIYRDAALSVSAPILLLQQKQQLPTTSTLLPQQRPEPAQAMPSTLQVLTVAPPRQSSLSDDLGKCKVNE